MTRTRSVRFRIPLHVERLEARDVPSFLPAVRYALAGEPWEVIVADLNNDGRRDVAATLLNSQVAVLLGDGTGQLGAPASFAVSDFPQALQVGDFNEDGKLDIVTGNRTFGIPYTGSVSLLFGVGDGMFLPQQQLATGDDGEIEVAVGDVNGDGNLDIATANQFLHSENAPDTVSILLGNGDGTFQTPIIRGGLGEGGANDIQIGDLDSDGLREVTVTGYWGGGLNVFYGNGNAGNYTAPVAAGHVQADINKDGHTDVVFGMAGVANVGLLINRGDGVFMPASYSAVAGSGSVRPVVADFNRDRRLDIASSATMGSLSLLLGNGDGTFQSPQTHPSNGFRFAVGLLNTDRYPDIVARTGSHISVILNDTVWAPPIPPAPRDERVQAALPTGGQLDGRTNGAILPGAEELKTARVTQPIFVMPVRRTLNVVPAFAILDDEFI